MQRAQTAGKMHIPAALGVKGLQVLPSTLRRLATAAYQPNADPKIVERVLKYSKEGPEAKCNGLLPICFVHLDTDALPDAAALLRDEADALAALHRGFVALATLNWIIPYDEGSSIDASLLPYFWPRAFVWSHFVAHDSAIWDMCLELCPTTHCRDIVPFHAYCLALGMFLFTGADREPGLGIGKPVIETPGVIEQLVQQWSVAVDAIGRDQDAIALLRNLNSYAWADSFRPVEGEHFTRMVDGAGGTVEDLAKIFFKCLSSLSSWVDATASAHAIDPVAATCGTALARIVEMILESDEAVRAADWPPKDQLFHRGPLCVALRRLGFIPIIIDYAMKRTMSLDLAPSTDDFFFDAAMEVGFSLSILFNVAGSSVGDRCGIIAAMVERNILEILVRAQLITLRTGENTVEHVEDTIGYFVTDVLTKELARHSGVLAIRDALPSLKESAVYSQILASEYGDMWRKFVDVDAAQRITLLDMFEDQNNVPQAACDNLKCSRISERSSFKRCSGCCTVYYCSKSCQKADWRRHQGHRAFCSLRADSSLLLVNRQRQLASHKDREFLRAILDHEHTTHWVDIHTKHALCLMGFRTRQGNFPSAPLITAFDLTTTPTKITVHLSSEASGVAQLLSDAGDEWADFLARATESESRGAFQLHVAKIYVDGLPRWVVIPLRSDANLGFDVQKAIRDIVEAVGIDRIT
ncbi:hypothetical protein MKEN_00975600 [Mycena kentingensis (nom. inval.)]|nr:hypothetical protein MKEN_00975600 [Mycena kentingensis (nom. inval.)]